MNPVDFVIVGCVILAAVWFFAAIRPLGWKVEAYLLFWATGFVLSVIGIAGMVQYIYDVAVAKGYW